MKTHIDTLADNTPKARRRLKSIFATNVGHGQRIAIARERREAKWFLQARALARNPNDPLSQEARNELSKKGYKV